LLVMLLLHQSFSLQMSHGLHWLGGLIETRQAFDRAFVVLGDLFGQSEDTSEVS
jgi:hypothetical protein